MQAQNHNACQKIAQAFMFLVTEIPQLTQRGDRELSFWKVQNMSEHSSRRMKGLGFRVARFYLNACPPIRVALHASFSVYRRMSWCGLCRFSSSLMTPSFSNQCV